MLRRSRVGIVLASTLVFTGWQAGPQQNVVSLMPEPDPGAGWKWDFETVIYTPDNLFEYINGEAEVYNDYTFVEMATGSHARTDDAMFWRAEALAEEARDENDPSLAAQARMALLSKRPSARGQNPSG